MRESASEACELRVDRLNVRDVFAPPSRECVCPSNVGDDAKENDEADMFGPASKVSERSGWFIQIRQFLVRARRNYCSSAGRTPPSAPPCSARLSAHSAPARDPHATPALP